MYSTALTRKNKVTVEMDDYSYCVVLGQIFAPKVYTELQLTVIDEDEVAANDAIVPHTRLTLLCRESNCRGKVSCNKYGDDFADLRDFNLYQGKAIN
jgi:hypothetical protein